MKTPSLSDTHVSRTINAMAWHDSYIIRFYRPHLLMLRTILMPSLSSPAAAADAPSMNSSLYYQAYDESGCNESSFHGKEVIITRLVAMEENVFCEVDVSSEQADTTYGKFITTCNDAEKTVMFQWYDCNRADCSICDESLLHRTWVTPISVWDEPTEETCFEVDLLPPYEPTWNTTIAISYRFTEDPSIYANVIVENSCISRTIASASASINTLQLQPISSYDWDKWLYMGLAIGFAVIFLERYFANNHCEQRRIE